MNTYIIAGVCVVIVVIILLVLLTSKKDSYIAIDRSDPPTFSRGGRGVAADRVCRTDKYGNQSCFNVEAELELFCTVGKYGGYICNIERSDGFDTCKTKCEKECKGSN